MYNLFLSFSLLPVFFRAKLVLLTNNSSVRNGPRKTLQSDILIILTCTVKQMNLDATFCWIKSKDWFLCINESFTGSQVKNTSSVIFHAFCVTFIKSSIYESYVMISIHGFSNHFKIISARYFYTKRFMHIKNGLINRNVLFS